MRFDFPRVQRTLGGEDLSRWDASRLKQKGAHAGEVTEIIDRMGMASATVSLRPCARVRTSASKGQSLLACPKRTTESRHIHTVVSHVLPLSSYGQSTSPDPCRFVHQQCILHTLSLSIALHRPWSCRRRASRL